MTDKMDEICINGDISEHELSKWRDFSIPVSNLLYSSLESRLIPAVLEGQVRLFWNWLGQEFDSCHIAVILKFDSILQAV